MRFFRLFKELFLVGCGLAGSFAFMGYNKLFRKKAMGTAQESTDSK